MTAVIETALLLMVVLLATTISAVSWEWDAPVITYGSALIVGTSCGRILRVVRRATT